MISRADGSADTVSAKAPERCHRGERPGEPGAQRLEQRVGHPSDLAGARSEAAARQVVRKPQHVHHHDLVGFLDRQRPERDAIDQGKRRGIGADGQAQGEDDQDGGRGRLAESAEDDAKVVAKVHGRPRIPPLDTVLALIRPLTCAPHSNGDTHLAVLVIPRSERRVR